MKEIPFLSIVISVIFGFLTSYLSQWPASPKKILHILKAKKQRRLKCYGFNNNGKIYLIPSSSSDSDRRYLSENDIDALNQISKMLISIRLDEGTDFNTYYQDHAKDNVPEAIRTENLILICGPKRNKIVETLLNSHKILKHIKFNLEPEVCFEYNGNKYIATETTDYAVFVVRKNPFNRNRKIVLMFGLRSSGTKGAGYFYAKENWAELRSKASSYESVEGEIELLLKVNYSDYCNIKDISLVE
jgi:hypothetical protein